MTVAPPSTMKHPIAPPSSLASRGGCTCRSIALVATAVFVYVLMMSLLAVQQIQIYRLRDDVTNLLGEEDVAGDEAQVHRTRRSLCARRNNSFGDAVHLQFYIDKPNNKTGGAESHIPIRSPDNKTNIGVSYYRTGFVPAYRRPYSMFRMNSTMNPSSSRILSYDYGDSSASVVKPGTYLLYVHITYYTRTMSAGYKVLVNNREVIGCVTSSKPRQDRSHATPMTPCHVTTSITLNMGDRVAITALYHGRHVLPNGAYTYWGLVKVPE